MPEETQVADTSATTQDQATKVDAATEQAFPGTDDPRTVADVDGEIKAANAEAAAQAEGAEAAAVELHPVHGVLDRLEAKMHEMGGFVVSQLKALIDEARALI